MAIKTYNAGIQLRPHFNSSEFMCKCGCKQIKIDDRLLDMLETLFTKCNAKTITITSGYRCPSYDKKIGGFAGKHSQGMAADIKIKGQDGNFVSSKIVSCVAQDEFANLGAGIANINSAYQAIHIDSRIGSVYRGNEIISNNSVTNDFYTYYKLTNADIQKATGYKAGANTPAPAPTPAPTPTPVTSSKTAKNPAAKKDARLAGTYVTTDALNMRNGAGTNNSVMVVIPKGTKVQNYGYYTTSGVTRWLYVTATVGKTKYTGFCSGSYLKKA